MSRESVLLAALTGEPMSTSDLYDRVGYLALTQIGLVPYAAFRAELERLDAAGQVACETGGDGSTLWWRPELRRALGSPGADGL